MKILLRLGLLLALLCLGSIAIPAVASAHGDCENTSDIDPNVHIGNDLNATSYPIRAAKVDIDPTEAGFRVCSHGNSNPGPNYIQYNPPLDAISAWVMLTEPGTSNYAQVGITRCNAEGSEEPSFCAGSANDGSDVRWFYQSHGCAQLNANTEDLGAADFYQHEYQIYAYNGTLYVKIDGVVKYSVDISQSERLSCWLTGNDDVMAKYHCEGLDEGDLCAHESDKLDFIDVQYIGWPNSSWVSPSAMTDPCDVIDDTTPFDARCDVVSSNDFKVWQNHQ